jgi:predicted  nucleic acid-binding Zn-ribbon protein
MTVDEAMEHTKHQYDSVGRTLVAEIERLRATSELYGEELRKANECLEWHAKRVTELEAEIERLRILVSEYHYLRKALREIDRFTSH